MAGDFIAHSRAVKLSYCHREIEPSTSHWNKKQPTSLPPGHYCVLLVGRRCPAGKLLFFPAEYIKNATFFSGFTAGSLSVFEGLLKPNETTEDSDPAAIEISDVPISTESAAHSSPRIFRDKVEKGDTKLTFDRVTYMFCCRADSPSATIPITGFPNDTGPFYLFR